MNYRHAFHAGNFADVLKHAVLARVIEYLKLKDAAFRVIDSHAGIGVYDLDADQASRTGEWRDGIGRLAGATLDADTAALLAPYLAVLRDLNGIADGQPLKSLKLYPGSPMLARKLLRTRDRLTLTELHPEDAAALAARFKDDWQVRVVELDGWLALKSFLPPKERRGLVLIDPPYEAPDEFDRVIAALIEAHRRFATGAYLIWYPIKDEAELRRFHKALANAGLAKMLAVDLRVATVIPGAPLAGCGLIVVNPPWTLADELQRLAPALARLMARGSGAGASVAWIAGE